jgi:hypothetical protein
MSVLEPLGQGNIALRAHRGSLCNHGQQDGPSKFLAGENPQQGDYDRRSMAVEHLIFEACLQVMKGAGKSANCVQYIADMKGIG